mmetsp:Transcript_26374/g.26622  ORF Transcript_26374/g.26622 Transcript_26374/m.26622 type:complete len:176 (-) Transcript_26374:177-704(-)
MIRSIARISPPTSLFSRSALISTKRKAIQREKAMKFAAKQRASQNLPEFKTLLWKFYRSVHPDLIRSSSKEKADINDVSMQKLNGILSTVKNYNEYPHAVNSELPFYFKFSSNEVESMDASDKLCKIDLFIKTAGGDCRHQLAASFETFFSKAGIHDGKFSWGNDYFPTEERNSL